MTPSVAPADTEARHAVDLGPERTPVHVVTYPMRTQPRPIRVTYMVDPAAFACAVLPEAAAILAHSGAGLAVKANSGGETPAAALAHDISPVLVLE